jgi:hypothetical protein
VRFTPGSFRYNGRVALALLPAMLVAAVLGGRPVLATLTMGALMWYIMDAMQYREGAFTVVRPSRAHTYTTDLPPPPHKTHARRACMQYLGVVCSFKPPEIPPSREK